MVRVIETQDQYDVALAYVYELMQPEIKENTPESEELELLSMLIEKYELANFPIT